MSHTLPLLELSISRQPPFHAYNFLISNKIEIRIYAVSAAKCHFYYIIL